MAIKLDDALGIHPQLLQFHTQRAQVLANNLANADTPNYKAQDLSFSATFKDTSSSGQALNLTQETLYRMPFQRSGSSNTVELSVEQAKFAENRVNYDTSMSFLKMKISGLRAAIEGR